MVGLILGSVSSNVSTGTAACNVDRREQCGIALKKRYGIEEFTVPEYRYTYLGDRWTREELRGMQCDPVRRADGRCVVSTKMATALVVDGEGVRYVVARRMLRLNEKLDSVPPSSG